MNSSKIYCCNYGDGTHIQKSVHIYLWFLLGDHTVRKVYAKTIAWNVGMMRVDRFWNTSNIICVLSGVGQWIPHRAGIKWETSGHGVSGPQALAGMHLCKFLFAQLPSVSDSISGTCLATRSSPSAEVTSGEQLLISVCMHTVCENMQDSKWLVYYLEVILPTGTELLENAPLTAPACRRLL